MRHVVVTKSKCCCYVSYNISDKNSELCLKYSHFKLHIMCKIYSKITRGSQFSNISYTYKQLNVGNRDIQVIYCLSSMIIKTRENFLLEPLRYISNTYPINYRNSVSCCLDLRETDKDQIQLCDTKRFTDFEQVNKSKNLFRDPQIFVTTPNN